MRRLFLVGFLVTIVAAGFLSSTVAQQHANILPAETIVSFSVRDFEQFQEAAAQTDLAKYLDDVAVQQMYDDISALFLKRPGITSIIQSTAFRSYASGELSWALLRQKKQNVSVVIADCAVEQDASNLVDEWVATFRKNGMQVQTENLGNITVFHAAQNLSELDGSGLYFCVMEKRVYCGGSKGSIARLLESGKTPLASVETYASSVFPDQKNGGEWDYCAYCNVQKLVAAARGSAVAEPDRKNIDLLLSEGFDAIQGIGGRGVFDKTEERRSLFHGQIVANKPFMRSMRLLDLENRKIESLPDWVRTGFASGYLNLQTRQLLESFSTLFDATAGEGEEGVFEAVLEDIKSDPAGPKVDVETEIIARLDTPIYVSYREQKSGSDLVIGVKVVDTAKVQAAFQKLFEGDPQAKPFSEDGFSGWTVEPLQQTEVGVREPYIIATKNNYLLIAPSLDVLKQCFAENRNRKNEGTSRDNSKELASFKFQIDLANRIQRFHENLRKGKPGQFLKTLLSRPNFDQAIESLDRSNWPTAEIVKRYLDTKIEIVGESNKSGWRIEISKKANIK